MSDRCSNDDNAGSCRPSDGASLSDNGDGTGQQGGPSYLNFVRVPDRLTPRERRGNIRRGLFYVFTGAP